MSEYFVGSVDALGLSGAANAAGSIYTVDTSDAVSLTDEWFAISFESTDSLGLTDTATVLQDIRVQVSESIALTDLYTDVWVWNTNQTDNLEVTVETFDPNVPEFTDVDIGLREEALAGGFVSVSTSDNIPFVETNNRWTIPAAGVTEAAIDSLGLTDVAYEPIEAGTKDNIGLADSATASVSQSSGDDLDLTDAASVVVIYGDLNAGDSLNFVESNNVLLIQLTPDCRPEFTYSPYIDPYQDPYTTGPVQDQGQFRLYYPETGPITDTLLLPSPNFGNKDRITPRRVNNQSRGGDLILFSDPAWGDPIETLLFSFSVMTEAQIAALLTWHDSYLGQEIRIVDQEERIWRGMITVVQDPTVQDRRKSYTASFEFEGTLIP